MNKTTKTNETRKEVKTMFNEEYDVEFLREVKTLSRVDLLKSFINSTFMCDTIEKSINNVNMLGRVRVYEKDSNITKIYYFDNVDTGYVDITKMEIYLNDIKKCYIYYSE